MTILKIAIFETRSLSISLLQLDIHKAGEGQFIQLWLLQSSWLLYWSSKMRFRAKTKKLNTIIYNYIKELIGSYTIGCNMVEQ